MALSRAEAEYVAQSETARDKEMFRNVMEDVSCAQDFATTLSQDNTAAIVCVEEGAYSDRAKHIDAKVYYTHEHIWKDLPKV